MRAKEIGVAACLLAGALWAAPAAAFDYSYIEGGVAFVDRDDPTADGDGPWAAVSLAASPDVHLFGHYRRAELDRSGGGTRTEEAWGVGLGNRRELARRLDLVVAGSFESVRTETGGGAENTDTGFAADLGLRLGFRLGPVGVQEVNAGVAYRYLDAHGDVLVRGGVVVPLTANVSVTGEARDDGDRWEARAGLRLAF
jgi:hypothetical protein